MAILDRDRRVERRQPGLVGQQLADGDERLAAGRELGPHAGNRSIDVELTPLPQEQGAGGGQAFGGREDHGGGVPLPRTPIGRVGRAAPEVDHRPAIDDHGDGGAHLAAIVEVPGERVTDGDEAILAATGHLGHPSTVPDR